MYVLVEFTDTKEVAVVPDNRLDGTSCAVWPTHVRASSKLTHAVQQKMSPGEEWPSFPIKELYRSESYSKVRNKLRKAEMESEVNTTEWSSESEDEQRRSRRKRRVNVFSSDEEGLEEVEEALPQTRRLPIPPRSQASPFGGSFSKATSSELEPVKSSVHASEMSSSQPAIHREQPGLMKTPVSRSRHESTPMQPTNTPTTPSIEPSVNIIRARDVRLFTAIEKISQKLICLEKGQDLIMASIKSLTSRTGSHDMTSLPEEVQLPVCSQEEMAKLDNTLADLSLLNAVISHLSMVGGHNLTDTVRRVMNRCLIHEMAVTFNWNGQKSKKAFKDLKLKDAVLRAVMKTCRCTASEVETVVRNWFRTASDRKGGRKKRGDKRKMLSDISLSENLQTD